SHAQRDNFERMTIDAGLKAGHYQEAKALIEDRTWRRSVEDSYARDRMTAALTENFGQKNDSNTGKTPLIALATAQN
ncbi:MAG: hypothetical protein ABJZ62_01335, partial [Hyphomicrobiales bacterium]